ncbi:MAG: hypothetical protein LBM77_07155, partial [Spirochaetaceae bacterium]|nr:hypothetical protein [Spirochaetaceae bacterium]
DLIKQYRYSNDRRTVHLVFSEPVTLSAGCAGWVFYQGNGTSFTAQSSPVAEGTAPCTEWKVGIQDTALNDALSLSFTPGSSDSTGLTNAADPSGNTMTAISTKQTVEVINPIR